MLEDGTTSPARVRRLAADRLEIVLHEGRKRQVRRMCEAVGHRVVRLERVAFGPLRLGDLPLGGYRRLTRAEVEQLRRDAAARNRSARARDPRRPATLRGWHNAAPMRLIAFRGANNVAANESEAILDATEALMHELIGRNGLETGDLVSCIFTLTPDLDAEFPAVAARRMGLSRVPLMCAQEIGVPGSMPSVIRVMIHAYADDRHDPVHVYLGETASLRQDLHGAQ